MQSWKGVGGGGEEGVVSRSQVRVFVELEILFSFLLYLRKSESCYLLCGRQGSDLRKESFFLGGGIIDSESWLGEGEGPS